MAQAGSIEVPIEPKISIPFHESEIIRVEVGRTTIVDSVPVRAADCDVLVDGERLHGCQAAVVVDNEPARSYEQGLPTAPQRILGATIKTRPDSDDEARLEALITEDETARHDVALVVLDAVNDTEVRRFEVTDARLIVPARLGKWTRLEFVGAVG